MTRPLCSKALRNPTRRSGKNIFWSCDDTDLRISKIKKIVDYKLSSPLVFTDHVTKILPY